MNGQKIGTLATLGAAASLTFVFGPSLAGTASPAAVSTAELGYEEVESIPVLTRPYSWQALDDDTVIVWATRRDPYLVELAFESHDLKFSQIIGITQFGNRIYAKFDAVTVGGFRYPIDSIYKMTREEARNLARGT
jgi:hypothetical protein